MSMFLALKEFYHLSVYSKTVISVGFGTHFYMKVQQRRLEKNVCNKMEEENKPRIPHRNPQLMIAREDLSNELFEFYFPGDGPKVKNYRIAGYFQGGKFSRIELFPAFRVENFHYHHGLYGVPIEFRG